MFKQGYASVFAGDENWNAIQVPQGEVYKWEDASTYVRNPPYFDGMTMTPGAVGDIRGARVLRRKGGRGVAAHVLLPPITGPVPQAALLAPASWRSTYCRMPPCW